MAEWNHSMRFTVWSVIISFFILSVDAFSLHMSAAKEIYGVKNSGWK